MLLQITVTNMDVTCDVQLLLKILIAVCFVIAFYLTRKFIAGGVCRSKARLDGKTVVITGGNCGIGKETAIELAKRGARIVLLCRDTEKAKRVSDKIVALYPTSQVLIHHLDLSSLASVRECAQLVLRSETRIDILINNAGIAATPQWKSEDGNEVQFATNHLGHFLLTHLLLDRLKQTQSTSRIINLSSIAHYIGRIHIDDINLENNYKPIRAYAQSKLANILYTRELARRVKEFNVHVYAVHPGGVRTSLGRHMSTAFNPFAHYFFVFAGYLFFKSARQGAQTTIFCAVDEDAGTHSGLYYADCKVTKPSSRAADDVMAKKLWELSEKMCGLTTQ